MFAFFSAYKYAFAGALAAALIGGLLYIRHEIIVTERNKVNAEWQSKENAIELQAKNTLIAKNNEIAKKQSKLDEVQRNIILKNRELEDAKQAYNNLYSKYANGTLRMRVRTKPLSESDTTKPSDSAAFAHGPDSGSAELMPDVSLEILGFARGYTDNLRKLNECRALYQSVYEAFRGD